MLCAHAQEGQLRNKCANLRCGNTNFTKGTTTMLLIKEVTTASMTTIAFPKHKTN